MKSFFKRILDSRLFWDLLGGPVYNRRILVAAGEMFTDLVNSLSPLPRGCRALDVGCGPGHLTGMLARANPLASVLGVDYSRRQIRAARRFLEKEPAAGCRFEVADAMRLPFADRSFDLVLSMLSVKHWPDPVRGLKEILRVLVPGGKAIVGEGDREADPEAIERFAMRFSDTWWLRGRPFKRMLKRTVLGQSLSGVELVEFSRQAGFTQATLRRRKDWIMSWVELSKDGQEP